MINKRLLSLGDKKPIAKIVACQVASMLLNALMIFRLAMELQRAYQGQIYALELSITALVFFAVILLRGLLKQCIARESHKASSGIKLKLRTMLYEKELRLGSSYTKSFSTAEMLQLGTEGVDQLESYFGSYLPQFFYCLIAPVLLFFIVAPMNFTAALVLFLCVPLIPISIMLIQKFAKKLLAKYWGLYANLGDNFLENLQGMTSLKIYEADEKYHENMNKSAQHFRHITMKVLSMQLNSIILMDTIAYGGAALGAIFAITALRDGSTSLMGAIVVILLAAEFFLPMRMMGSFFHIAMNGMAAADKMFQILDMEEPKSGREILGEENLSSCQFVDVGFSYTKDKAILKSIDFTAKTGITALVGTSGSGKSTIASLLSLKEHGYTGSIQLGDKELSTIAPNSLHQHLTRVSDQGYSFTGTVAENLRLAKEDATEAQMLAVLKKVQLWDFLTTENGLDTTLSARGSNFSGGQRQRLNLARALLRDSAVYIFDEVTSNVDAESENVIMKAIYQLAESKIVILISHRLANVVNAQQILLLKNGVITENGSHHALLAKDGDYATLFLEQQSLEEYALGGDVHNDSSQREATA